MTEEKSELKNEDEPEIYIVKKSLRGWQFNRRDFLKAASAVTATSLAGCGPDPTPDPTTPVLPTESPTRTPTKSPTSTTEPSSTPTQTSTSTPTPESTATLDPTTTPVSTSTPDPEQMLKLQACSELRAHKYEVTAMAISPEGSFLASWSRNNPIKIWSLPIGVLLATIPTQTSQTGVIRSLAISPDGKFLASGSLDSLVQLWSLPAGNLFATLNGHTDSVTDLVFSPDGTLLASRDSDKTLMFWSLPSGGQLARVEEALSWSISPDWSFVAVGSLEVDNIKLFSIPDGELLAQLEGHSQPVSDLLFSPDGSHLVSAGLDGSLNLWAVPAWELLASIDGGVQGSNSLAMSPDGRLLASRSWDDNIKLWSVPAGKLLATLNGPSERNQPLVINPGGSVLASVNKDAILLWALPNGELLATLSDHIDGVRSLAMGPDDSFLVSGSGNGAIKFYSLPDGIFQTCLIDYEPPVKNRDDFHIIQYEIDIDGKTYTYRLPAGLPIPEGGVCVCNTVIISGCGCVGDFGGGIALYWYPN